MYTKREGNVRGLTESGKRVGPKAMVGIVPVGCNGGVGELLLMCCGEVQD